MLTPKLGGIFDCRKFDNSKKLTHEQRQMVGENDTITFNALLPIDGLDECFKTNGQIDECNKPKANREEREKAAAENREPKANSVAVKFKIHPNAKWFDKHAKPMQKPTNEELEAYRWNVQIDFTKKAKDQQNPLAPSGYWVNSIMAAKIENNPFEGCPFETSDEIEDDPQEQEQTQGQTQEQVTDLPF